MEEIIKRLKEAAREPDSRDDLMEAYLDYVEGKNEETDTLLYEFGLPQDKRLLDEIVKIEEGSGWEEVVCKKAEKYLGAFEDKKLSHKKRRDRIEDAIRILKDLYERKGISKPETLTLLAKAYLRRNQIIRPKGRTIPEKKKEAIQKGGKVARAI